jgi:hypothetical protein
MVSWMSRVAVLAMLAVACGCARERESGPKLTGRVLVDGQPGRPASVNDFDVKFLSVDGTGPGKRSYLAGVQPDGTFVVNGSIGQGIPTGRYKVIIVGSVLDAKGKPSARYDGKFNEKATPLEVEITDTSREVTIDLGRKSVTAS